MKTDIQIDAVRLVGIAAILVVPVMASMAVRLALIIGDTVVAAVNNCLAVTVRLTLVDDVDAVM